MRSNTTNFISQFSPLIGELEILNDLTVTLNFSIFVDYYGIEYMKKRLNPYSLFKRDALNTIV